MKQPDTGPATRDTILLQSNAALLERRFLADAREHRDPDTDVPVIWGLEPVNLDKDWKLDSPAADYDWHVTFYCEQPGNWHPVKGPHERIATGSPFRAAGAGYAVWLLPRFELRVSLNRKLGLSRSGWEQSRAMNRHLAMLRTLSSDPAQRQADATSITDFYQIWSHEMRPVEENARSFAGLTRTLSADGCYRWLCPTHAGQPLAGSPESAGPT